MIPYNFAYFRRWDILMSRSSMNAVSDWYLILAFFCSAMGVVVSCVLFFVNRNDNFTSNLLALFLLFLSIVGLNTSFMYTDFYMRFPHMWRVLGFAGFLFAPASYLYVRSVLEQSYRFKKWDFLWLLPALLYMLSLFPFFFSGRENKLWFIGLVRIDPSLILDEPEGLLPVGWGVWGRLIVNLLAWGAQGLLLMKWKARILGATEPLEQNRYLLRWLSLFTFVLGFFLLLLLYQFTRHFSGQANQSLSVLLTICLTIVFISLSLLIRPSILYGMTGWMQEPEVRAQLPKEVAEESEPEPQEPRKPTLSLAQGLAYKQSLESHFEREKPFLRKGYKISDLSNELEIPYHQLSAFINQEYGKNFNELVNEYRVDHLVRMHGEDPALKQYTLEALGQKVGFNSRVAFIAAVKRRTGKTPSEIFGRREEAKG